MALDCHAPYRTAAGRFQKATWWPAPSTSLEKAFSSATATGEADDVDTLMAALGLFDALCRGSGITAFATLAETLPDGRIETVTTR